MTMLVRRHNTGGRGWRSYAVQTNPGRFFQGQVRPPNRQSFLLFYSARIIYRRQRGTSLESSLLNTKGVSKKSDCFYVCASIKRVVTNIRDIIRNGDGCEPCATVKCLLVDGGHVSWNSDRCEPGTSKERTVSDVRDTIRNGDGCELITSTKRQSGDRCYSV